MCYQSFPERGLFAYVKSYYPRDRLLTVAHMYWLTVILTKDWETSGHLPCPLPLAQTVKLNYQYLLGRSLYKCLAPQLLWLLFKKCLSPPNSGCLTQNQQGCILQSHNTVAHKAVFSRYKSTSTQWLYPGPSTERAGKNANLPVFLWRGVK